MTRTHTDNTNTTPGGAAPFVEHRVATLTGDTIVKRYPPGTPAALCRPGMLVAGGDDERGVVIDMTPDLCIFRRADGSVGAEAWGAVAIEHVAPANPPTYEARPGDIAVAPIAGVVVDVHRRLGEAIVMSDVRHSTVNVALSELHAINRMRFAGLEGEARRLRESDPWEKDGERAPDDDGDDDDHTDDAHADDAQVRDANGRAIGVGDFAVESSGIAGVVLAMHQDWITIRKPDGDCCCLLGSDVESMAPAAAPAPVANGSSAA